MRRGKRKRSGLCRCSCNAVQRDGSAEACARERPAPHFAGTRTGKYARERSHHQSIYRTARGEAMSHWMLQTKLFAVLCAGAALAILPARMHATEAAGPEGSTAAAHEAAKGDPLLEALLTELDRSTAQLKMDKVQAPYYIEYRVNDLDDFSAEAAFGALRENQRSRRRVLRVVVRIGDYKQDSYYNQGLGPATILPLDNDPIALRRQIWLLTDEAYKAAADAYAEKLSALKQFSAEPNPVDDFARAPVISAVGDIVSMRVDEPAWDKTLQDVTRLYRQYPGVQALTASARFTAIN